MNYGKIKPIEAAKIISDLTEGQGYTKEQALEAYKMHIEGVGANTVGHHYNNTVYKTKDLTEAQITKLGDTLINLGKTFYDTSDK